MFELEQIQRPVEAHLQKYNEFMRSVLTSESDYINEICEYIIGNRGKQMRPLLVLLSAALNGGVSEDSYKAAALVELLHTASLVHDDVVDESDLRRGIPAVHAKWNSRTAVLVGDFMFARAFFNCWQSDSRGMLEITEALYEVGEGELMQTEQSRKLDMGEDLYYRIIDKKTASLIGAAAAAGAISSGAGDAAVDAMRRFGRNLGMAFQIKDDILDYDSTGVTGKPRGADIRESKMNLPMIYILSVSDDVRRRELTGELSNAWRDPKTVDELCETVISKGGLEYARGKMTEYYRQAVDILGKYPDSDVLASLRGFADFVIGREK